MENRYKVWNKWDPLKVVMLGDTYRPEFYDDIKDDRVRDVLLKICEETLEDLAHFEKVLKDFGCKVIRPYIDPKDNIMNYVGDKGKLRIKNGGIPKPPLNPRDEQFVAGDKLFICKDKGFKYLPQIQNPLLEYNSKDVVNIMKTDVPGSDIHTANRSAPQYTIVGRDLYIDDYPKRGIENWQRELLFNNIPNLRINSLSIGGHNDAVFNTIKEGAILSLNEIQTYEDTFPGWDVCYLPNQSWEKVSGFGTIKHKVRGRWWVPGEEDNDEFLMYVETWLDEWVGYVEETVFDVNVLTLDEHHVCVTNPDNEQVKEFLKKHKMEAVHVPWRHRYFYDGGLHCITLDLYREGTQKDYFPNRNPIDPRIGVTDLGFN